MIIYADEIFIENFAAVYAMLYIYSKIFLPHTKARRIFAGAIAGALGASIQFIYNLNILIFLNIIIYLVSFGIKSGNLLQNIVVFSVYQAAIWAGACFICSQLGLGIIRNNVIYFSLNMKWLILSLALSYPLTITAVRLFKSKAKKRLCRIQITKNKKTVNVTAIFDSGNILKEPVSGLGIIVTDREVCDALFPNGKIDPIRDGLKFIPYKTIGNSGVMAVFPADEVLIDNKPTERFFIGISPKKLSQNNEYNALIGG